MSAAENRDYAVPSMASAEGRRAWLRALIPPQKLDGESDGEWTDRIHREGAANGKRRQCSIGWHDECSDPEGAECRCVCHMDEAPSTLDLARWLSIVWDEADAAEEKVERLEGVLYDAIMSPSDDPEMFEVDLNHDVGRAFLRPPHAASSEPPRVGL